MSDGGRAAFKWVPDDTKVCSMCGEAKALEAFHRHRSLSKGRANQCKLCRSTTPRPQSNKKVRAYLADLTLKQDGACAICRTVKPLCMDHDHRTGKLRKAICHRCNLVLGHVRDDTVLLDKMRTYLANGLRGER